MSANEATRLRAKDEHPVARREEESAARPLVRDAAEQAASSVAASAPAEGESASTQATAQSLDELERAAENIRPSWHGAEIEAGAALSGGLSALGDVPAALPPPPALPSFSSFPIEQRAPLYSADSTVRTAAVLPERLAELLNQPQIAHASHWLRARPWAIAGLAVGAVILLALLFWPAAEPGQVASKPPLSAAPHAPAPPPPSAASTPANHEQAPAVPAASLPGASEPAAPAPGAKKRDKRAGRAAGKPLAPKTRKPAKAAGAPAAAR